MRSSKYFIAIRILLVLLFAVSAVFYPQLPDRLASHWNAAGEADGYSSKFWGLFMLPLIATVLALLLILIPRLDPLKTNIEKFKGSYYQFIVAFLIFFLYIQALTIVFNLGYTFNMTLVLMPAFAILFYFVGTMVGKAKRNYFIGIRTPWTLASDTVWDKTHALGAKLFKIAAGISLIGILFGQYAVWFMLVSVLIAAITTIIYSYIIFQREGKPRAASQ